MARLEKPVEAAHLVVAHGGADLFDAQRRRPQQMSCVYQTSVLKMPVESVAGPFLHEPTEMPRRHPQFDGCYAKRTFAPVKLSLNEGECPVHPLRGETRRYSVARTPLWYRPAAVQQRDERLVNNGTASVIRAPVRLQTQQHLEENAVDDRRLVSGARVRRGIGEPPDRGRPIDRS